MSGLGFAWTLENLVVSLSREEGKGQKIKQVKHIWVMFVYVDSFLWE